ncbi:MAG: enoyl-CoA hydratase-related protein [Wenzhouxiangellaceae bacterium]
MLLLEHDPRGVAVLTLDRPEVHNAFNAELIAELGDALKRLHAKPPRVLVLTGQGRSFSAGADLGWMRSMADAEAERNRDDARRLAAMFRALDELPCPTIARVNGPAFGGGVGLICCCDVTVGVDRATFALSEVRLGLIPATIAPFVINRIGAAASRRLMLSGMRISASEALAAGLLDEVVDSGTLDVRVRHWTEAFLDAAPGAVAECKALIRCVVRHSGDPDQLDAMTADWIARIRAGAEGREGTRAFLEKRQPAWVNRETGN